MSDIPKIKIVGISHTDKARNKYVNALCSCGNYFISRLTDIKSGHTKSCGCYAKKVRRNNLINHLKKSNSYQIILKEVNG